MKMLLLSQNPVVNKLVTLSAQKTGDELVVAEALGAVEKGTYDLLIVDEGLYDGSVMEEVHERIAAVSTLFMGAHGTEVPEGFDHTLKKPFLPTDLVKLFVDISNEGPTLATPPEESDTIELAKAEETFAFDEGEAMEIESLEDAEIPMELGEELLGELPDLEEEGEAVAAAEEEDVASILDEEEVHEVQSLLEDTDEAEVEPLLEDEPVSAGLNDATLDEVKSALDDLEGDDESAPESGESGEPDLSGLELDDEILEDTADISGSELPEEELDLGELDLGDEVPMEEAPEAEEETLDLGDLEFDDEALSEVSDEASEADTLDLGDLDFGDEERDHTDAGEADIDLADLEAADQAADQLLEEAASLEVPEAEAPDLEELDFATEEEAQELLGDTEEESATEERFEAVVTDEDFDLGDLDLEMEEERESGIEESVPEVPEAEEEPAVEEAGDAVGELELTEESETPADEAFDLGDLDLDMEDEAAETEEGSEESLEAPEGPAVEEAGEMLGDMEPSEASQSPLDESFDLGEEVTLGELELEETQEDEEETAVSDLLPDMEEPVPAAESDEEAAESEILAPSEAEEAEAGEKTSEFGDLGMETAADELLPETADISAEAVPEAEAEEMMTLEEAPVEKRDLSAEAEALMSEAAAEAAISDDFDLEEEISAADEALDFEGLDLDDTADFVDTEGTEAAATEERAEEESTVDTFGAETAEPEEVEQSAHEELDLDEEMTEFLTTDEPEAELPEEADEDTTLKNLEAEIESAVSELSDEELAEEIDEETLLDIVNAEDYDEGETTAVVDEFDTLDSAELKAALGETEESAPSTETEEGAAVAETEETPAAEQMSPDEGLQALQTLVKALENKEVIKSLKGMNISINITFGDND